MSEILKIGLPLRISDRDGKTILSGAYVANIREVVEIVNEYIAILNTCAMCCHRRSDHFTFDEPAYCCDGCSGYAVPLTYDQQAKAIAELTAERDKYRDACERLVATGANLVKVIEAATVIETMFVMGNRKDKAFQEVEQIVGAKNLLKRQLADAVDFARQVKAELEGIEGSEIEVEVE